MTYKEVKHSNGSFRRVWSNENGELHREDGPAIVWYNSDGSIYEGKFSLHGELIGYNEEGFWALWDNLTDDKRKNPELLKYLVRFS